MLMLFIKVLFWTFLFMAVVLILIRARYKNFMRGKGDKIIDV